MSWTRVQGNSVQGSGTSQSLTLTSTVSTGNVVCGGVLINQPLAVTKVTDDKNNVYDISTGFVLVNGSVLNIVGFFSVNAINNAPQTITVTVNGSSANIWIVADEFSPPAGTTNVSLDGTNQWDGLPSASSTTFQNLASNVLIYEANFCTAATTASSPYTSATNNISQIASGYLVQTGSSTTNNASFTTAGTNYGVAFGVAPIARPSWQVVQHIEYHGGTATTTRSVSLPNPTSKGNVLLIALAPGTATDLSTLTSIVDDLGGNYVPNIISNTVILGSPVRFMTWSGGQLTTTPQTITATFSVSQAGDILFQVVEVAPPPRTNSVFIDSSLGSNTPTAITSSGSNEFFFNIAEPIFGGAGYPVPSGPVNEIEGYFSSWNDVWNILPNPTSTTINYVGNGGGLFTYTAVVLGSTQTPLASGRQISEEEFNKALAEYSKRSYDELKAASIREAAANLGRLGGHARAKALSTATRSEIALMGANARWQKR